MEYKYIGNSGLRVSSLGLGSMTFGTNASKKEAFKILEKAYENGVNFIDTAEMYPSPISEDTVGISEKWVGEWLKTKSREITWICIKLIGLIL